MSVQYAWLLPKLPPGTFAPPAGQSAELQPDDSAEHLWITPCLVCHTACPHLLLKLHFFRSNDRQLCASFISKFCSQLDVSHRITIVMRSKAVLCDDYVKWEMNT